jgi:hypothetical protein
MDGFWIGCICGGFFVFLIWVAYLEIRVQSLTKNIGVKSVDAKISSLTNDELTALVDKDLGPTAKPN